MKGHIRRRSKLSWAIVIDLDRGADGKRKQKWYSVKGTKKKAEEELVRILASLQTGFFIEPTKITVAELLRRWLSSIELKVAIKTYERYEEIAEKHLIPAMGHLKLVKLHPNQIEEYYSQALKTGKKSAAGGGLSKQTVLHHHRILHEALQKAVKWHLLISNASDAVDLPKPDKIERLTFTQDEATSVLRVAHGKRIYLPILLALTTGLRRGEILGLRWKDIDLDKARLAVRQILQETRKGGPFVKEPKTQQSTRTVTLPSVTVEQLRLHRINQAKLGLRLARPIKETDLVMADSTGACWAPSALTSAYRDFTARHKLKKVTFHDLRHTHATHLLEQNIHPKVVSVRLGHSSVKITLDLYSHVTPNLQAEAADKTQEIFKKIG